MVNHWVEDLESDLAGFHGLFWCWSHPGGGKVHRWLWGLFWIPLDVRVVSWASSPNASPSEGDTPLLGSQLKIHPNMTNIWNPETWHPRKLSQICQLHWDQERTTNGASQHRWTNREPLLSKHILTLALDHPKRLRLFFEATLPTARFDMKKAVSLQLFHDSSRI